MNTQTTAGTFDRSSRTYLFDIDQETMAWSGTIEALQAMVSPHGFFAFVCQSQTPPVILIGEGLLISIPKERGWNHASYILLARANALVREISNGNVTYTRTLREGERLSRHKRSASKQICPPDYHYRAAEGLRSFRSPHHLLTALI